MDKARRTFIAASTLAPLALVHGCARPTPLTRVGGIMWIGYEPMFLARDMGLYDPGALRLVEMPSNTANLMALAAGDVEAATLTLDECLLALEGGLDVRAILVFDYSSGADVVMARPEIRDLQDLRGRRIGVEETAAGALMLAKLLEAAGLSPGEIVKVRVTADRHVQAYRAGEVDVLVSWEPHATQLEMQGAHRLFDSRSFPGLIVDVLVARTSALAQAPDSFRQLLAGYFRALAYLRQAPADALRRMAPRLGVTAGDVAKAYQGLRFMDAAANRDWLAGSTPRLPAAAANVGRIMTEAHLLRRIPTLDKLVDPHFLPSNA